jgi:hypothetical protein
MKSRCDVSGFVKTIDFSSAVDEKCTSATRETTKSSNSMLFFHQ